MLVLALASVFALVVVALHLLARPERAHAVLREHACAALRGSGPANEPSAGSVGLGFPRQLGSPDLGSKFGGQVWDPSLGSGS